jgi:hypothetical protein
LLLGYFVVQSSFGLRVSFADPNPWAERLDLALGAIGAAGDAAAAAVPDEPVTEHGPLVPGHKRHEFLLDFDGVGLASEAQALGEAGHVSVHDHT